MADAPPPASAAMAVAPPPALGKDPPAPASTKVIFKDYACDVSCSLIRCPVCGQALPQTRTVLHVPVCIYCLPRQPLSDSAASEANFFLRTGPMSCCWPADLFYLLFLNLIMLWASSLQKTTVYSMFFQNNKQTTVCLVKSNEKLPRN
jgi:hypothetical protein